MIALDTNLLVYAHREDSPFHEPALAVLQDLIGTGQRFAVPWPCAHEFVSIVTHARIYKNPTPLATALDFVQVLQELEHCSFLAEGDGHWPVLRALAEPARVQGGAIHDARIAALCLQHGVRELWSADRDFTRYPRLKLRNPLVG